MARHPAAPAASPTCAVDVYARGVVAGTTPAGHYVQLACARHVRDREDGAERGLRFDVAAAEHAIRFFGFLCHSKGEWAGTALTLAPWQCFVVGSLFGWKRADGTRRFRRAYNEVPRKNGKSTITAGVGLYMLVADNEPGAEVYCAATKRDQARIVWEEARRMVLASPALRGRIECLRGNLNLPGTASKMEPLGADADTLDGLNSHANLTDELHAHKTRDLVDKLETATGARAQPLDWYITTAGWDRQSICYELHDYSRKVLEGTVADDSHFAYVASIDTGDRWDDEAVWAKANPNLGVSVKLDDLRRKAQKAKEMPAAQNAFRRLHLNEWTEQADRWLDVDLWERNTDGPLDPDALAGRECFVGLDLSSTIDITAAALLFPRVEEGERWKVLWRFWMPKEGLRAREDRDRVPYGQWAADGWITLTEGNVVDYDVIRRDLNAEGARYAMRELSYDPWNATQLATQMQGDGWTVVPMRQGFASLSEPTKALEKMLLGDALDHGANPVARWMAANVSVKQDPAGNLKPDKSTSTGRIDGIAALVNAIARATVAPATAVSVYESRGLVAL